METINSTDIPKVLGVDISNTPSQSVNILVGIEPKVKCKNKHLQKILVKLFGNKAVFKEVKAKVVKINADDYPKGCASNVDITLKQRKRGFP